ncbi:MAG TPA: hypothetical protein DEA08_02915 [Planctomycetes bacterium]|nr:hypothetical protein [Planctomycetota bacterium]
MHRLLTSTLLALSLGTVFAGCSGGGGGGGGSSTPSTPSSGGFVADPIPPTDPVPAFPGGGSTGGTTTPVAPLTSTSEAPLTSELAPSKAFELAEIPADFDFATVRSVAFDVKAAFTDASPVANTLLQIRVGDEVVYKGLTDAQGALTGVLQVSSAVKELRFELATIGIQAAQTIALSDSVAIRFGGAQ